MKTIILTDLIFLLALVACNGIIGPGSGELNLILTSDKNIGRAPLTVKFQGYILGESEGVRGAVPDYTFFPKNGKTIIPYGIPDTSQEFIRYWSDEITYDFSGKYNVVLWYSGIKDGKDFLLISDSLLITITE